ncbi:MAG: pilus assembly protein PilP [Deltaproteobacteria bacterium]
MRKKQNNKKFYLPLFVCLVLILAACGEKRAQAPQPALKPKPVAKTASPAQTQPSSAKVTVSTSPQFNFDNKKDPFRPFVVETKPEAKQTRGGSSSTGLPITNYEVNQFRVLGIITGLKEDSALVVDPAGKAYVVKKGMQIGKNNGHIVQIKNRAIEIFENTRDESGKFIKRTVRLTLPRKE